MPLKIPEIRIKAVLHTKPYQRHPTILGTFFIVYYKKVSTFSFLTLDILVFTT